MASLRTASLEEIRQAAARICRDYLNGPWKEVSADQLIVKRMSGGLSNYLYYVSLPQELNSSGEAASGSSLDNDENRNESLSLAGDGNGNKRKRYDSSSCSLLRPKEPKEVLLRIYGHTQGKDALEAMITESVVFALLSERHFGPRLHGIFPGGRIEQFIPARALLTDELAIPEISIKIAEKMAEIHTLDIPMSKEPDWAWKSMDRWLSHIPDILARTDWKVSDQSHIDFVKGFDYPKQIAWLKAAVKKCNSPVAFCHNDLQEGNILLMIQNSTENINEDSVLDNEPMQEETDIMNSSKKSADLDCSDDSALGAACNATNSYPDLRIIDFEYCAYNYRGFDLANHFLEWTFDYSNPEYPYYHFRKHAFPNKEQRHRFIRTYLKRLHNYEWEPSQEEIEAVDQEVRLFKMFSHIFWSLWSVVSTTSNIEFAYWHYANTRLREFLELQQNYITDNMMTI